MIGWLSGKIRSRKEDRLLIDTGGVGYEVQVAKTALPSLGNAGDSIEIYVHTHVREDSLSLFGFPTLAERELFLQLVKVSGVGAKMAMSILSALPMSQLTQAIQNRDINRLRQTPGIGKRMAERLVTELADRMAEIPVSSAKQPDKLSTELATSSEDVISALLNLGYKQHEAQSALVQINFSKFTTFDTILKETLKVLAK